MKNLGNILKAGVIALLVIAQFVLILLLSFYFNTGDLYIYYSVMLVGLCVIVGLINSNSNYTTKTGWLIIIAVLPIAGIIMYVLWGSRTRTRRTRNYSRRYLEYGNSVMDRERDERILERFGRIYPNRIRMARYMEEESFPLTCGNSFRYYDSGESAFDAVLEDIKNARRFIFLDFFIVADGALLEKVKKLLIGKAREGVEIRFLYDDFGAMFRTTPALWRELEEAGIKTAAFNPVHKYLNTLHFNYRSHQKIIIIDGEIGYTGGFNLADEYVNGIERFGYWKDSGIRIEGNGVFGLTSTFLTMWDMTVGADFEDFRAFAPKKKYEPDDAFCQIVSDGPDNNPVNPMLSVIRQMIYNAEDFLYITTPYLIIEDDLKEALIDAAKSGIDVRIITPAIPDKKMVYKLTRYNYGRLLEGGVRIYEYTPGFIHAKTFITRHCGMVGTVNLDYRSLYLHYECSAVIWEQETLKAICSDIEKTCSASEQVDYAQWKGRPLKEKLMQGFLNIFSGLL